MATKYYIACCISCFSTRKIGDEYVTTYATGQIECPCAEFTEWTIQPALFFYSDEYFANEANAFAGPFFLWLSSDEGKVAQERARYNV